MTDHNVSHLYASSIELWPILAKIGSSIDVLAFKLLIKEFELSIRIISS